MPLDHNFLPDAGNYANVNLSTSSSASSRALLADVRAQRMAREQQRAQERAAVVIQKVWRGRSAARNATVELLERLETGEIQGVERRGRALVVLLRPGWLSKDISDRRRALIADYLSEGVSGDLLLPLRASSDWITVVGLLCLETVNIISEDPQSSDSSALLTALEAIVSPAFFASLSGPLQETIKAEFAETVGNGKWVRSLVIAMEKLIATNRPKKKNPLITPIVKLLTAPLGLSPSSQLTSLLIPLLNVLLALPALPQSVPIPALTHLSLNLPLFQLILPLAASQPDLLDQGRLQSELGKTYFLANLATFGITGGLLERNGGNSAAVWIKVLGTVLQSMGNGWGRWVDGIEDEDVVMPSVQNEDDSDDDGDPPAASTRRAAAQPRIPSRPSLPKNISSKILLLASMGHLTPLTNTLVSPSAKMPTTIIMEFANFVLSLLSAFKGSPKWESILEALLVGTKGKVFSRRVWREGVRGRWTNTSNPKAWDTFAENPSAPCLLLLTHMYNHYLLITPDAEFFTESVNGSNPLSQDEILELTSIWRDLAFWGYMNGVAPAGPVPKKGKGTEDSRSLLTRGVTRIAERNARRKFAPDSFFVMASQMDLQGFIAAAVLEDAQLTTSFVEGGEVDMADLPRWARARNKFSKRQIAYLSPRLGLLNNLPMVIPFGTRLEIFQQFINHDYETFYRSGSYHGRTRATIHRTSLAEDGFDQLSDAGPALKGRVQITFIDKFGNEESGIDGGGLFKEFLTSLTKEVFNTDRGLWLATDQNELYPNPHSYASEPHQLSWYTFIGRVLGKALYDGILVDVSFAGFFLAKWLGRQTSLDDLHSLDSELYKGLIILKDYPRPEELSLNFTISQEEFGVTQTIDLVPGGSDIPVTLENRHEYIQLVCRYKLDKQIAAQSKAFFSGLSDIIDSKWLRMFDQQELQQVIGGEETPIDIDDLRAHTVVSGFPNDDTMRIFWKVIKGFNQEQRRALLRFVTSCSRPPLLGFGHLSPNFGVRCSGSDKTRLPSASSCANLLKLPPYDSEESLKAKLLQSIESGSGFDLS